MILLTLSLLNDQLSPPRGKQMDRIDHALRWTIKVCLVVLFLTLPDVLGVDQQQQKQQQQRRNDHNGGSDSGLVDGTDDDNNDGDNSDFFFSCSGGKFDSVRKALREHPDWVHRRTDNGETCLHLTGIYGHAPVTSLLLESGADPNVRSTYGGGLRMHPLSWNVYGGHAENIELLLRHGADVNLDFDSMVRRGDDDPAADVVTALDVVLELRRNEAGDDRFERIEQILRRYGAKTMAELTERGRAESVRVANEEEL
jgi:ankyrin repeat protein